MQRIGKIIGIAAAIIIGGTLTAYAMMQADVDVPQPEEIQETVTEAGEEITEEQPGFGQVEKEEGAYTP